MIALLLRAWLWLKDRPAALISAGVAIAGFLYLTRARKPPAGRSLDREQEDERVRSAADEERREVDRELRESIAEAEAAHAREIEAIEADARRSDDPEVVAQDIEDLLP